MLLPSDGGCTTKVFAVYAQTCYYSASDVLQYCDPEQYLYTIEQTFCSNNGGGGGGGGVETPQCPPGTSPPAQPNPPPPTGPPVEMELREGKKIIRFVQGGDGNCVVNPPQDIINKVKDPCLNAMVDAVINTNIKGKVNEMIQNIFGTPSNINLTFTDQVALSTTNRDAETVSTIDGSNVLVSAEIRLKPSVLAFSSQEFIAATILHEALHAYMDHQGIDLDQHAFMATNYLTTMAADLQQLFPGMVSDVAYSLAWGGLENTYWYNNPGELTCPGYQSEINSLLRAHKVDGHTYGHGCT